MPACAFRAWNFPRQLAARLGRGQARVAAFVAAAEAAVAAADAGTAEKARRVVEARQQTNDAPLAAATAACTPLSSTTAASSPANHSATRSSPGSHSPSRRRSSGRRSSKGAQSTAVAASARLLLKPALQPSTATGAEGSSCDPLFKAAFLAVAQRQKVDLAYQRDLARGGGNGGGHEDEDDQNSGGEGGCEGGGRKPKPWWAD